MSDREYIMRQLRGVRTVLVGLLAGLAVCALITLVSCSGRIVTREVPVVVKETSTEYKVQTQAVHDTLLMRDSVYHYVQGDTVRIERWHYLHGTTSVARVDTVLRVDTVPSVVTVTETKEVAKPPAWWQSFLKFAVGFAMGLIIIRAVGAKFKG